MNRLIFKLEYLLVAVLTLAAPPLEGARNIRFGGTSIPGGAPRSIGRTSLHLSLDPVGGGSLLNVSQGDSTELVPSGRVPEFPASTIAGSVEEIPPAHLSVPAEQLSNPTLTRTEDPALAAVSGNSASDPNGPSQPIPTQGPNGAPRTTALKQLLDWAKQRAKNLFAGAVEASARMVSEAPSGSSRPKRRRSDALNAPLHPSTKLPDYGIDDSASLIYYIGRARQDREMGQLRPAPEDAKNFVFVAAPGLGWELAGDPNKGGAYMRHNINQLRAMGLRAEFIPTNPLGTTWDNAQIMADAIKKLIRPGMRLILLLHSKAVLDMEKTLEQFSELRGYIHGAIALQAPYFGSPWADWFLKRFWVLDAMAIGAKILHPWKLGPLETLLGQYETVRELSRERRSKIPRKRPKIWEGMRLVSVASQIWPRKLAAYEQIKMRWFRALSLYGIDGVVRTEDSIVPGFPYAVLNNVSHMETVTGPDTRALRVVETRMQWSDFAGDFTEGLIHWYFSIWNSKN